MANINTDLDEGACLERLRSMLASRLSTLALTKEELTEARVEPFRIDLTDPTPSFEKPMRYNR